MKVLCVAAARPNFMKVKPVLDALEARGIGVHLVHTGQHYDPLLSDVFFEELGLRAPDLHLGVGSGTHAQQTAGVMVALEPVVAELAPEMMVVVGDVNSTMAAALVSAKARVRLAHVEAGLRSGDRSMPEEINRIVTDRLSDVLFAPSPDAVDNLRAEGHPPAQIHLVGNVMIDTLLGNLDRALDRPVLDRLRLDRGGYALVTLHRPANVDDPDVLRGLLAALASVSRQLPVVFPVHPRARSVVDALGVGPGIRVLDPLGYLDFVALEAGAAVVLTDSGGVQEETTVLGVPCLTLRDSTERPITVEEGTNRVIGRGPQVIVAEVDRVLRHGVPARCPALWDGHAAERIAEVVLTELTGER
ncbi:non-hydrolyzing UDP-N-acetylglucosamine 2-epimerase [Rhabdothermincola sediminis]|uniref:non-hydrolyzing UDP-N-acetylglucosamine 2-epimerase n=1 Tax=Rhabdothermincola sediminis TaxID=2751370 RepID=UPI001AA06F43|nr:UDP-N-acetylglucosamine 2-epimerase (non-hydrolyzing) [Rhabdothermincola sediminis]